MPTPGIEDPEPCRQRVASSPFTSLGKVFHIHIDWCMVTVKSLFYYVSILLTGFRMGVRVRVRVIGLVLVLVNTLNRKFLNEFKSMCVK